MPVSVRQLLFQLCSGAGRGVPRNSEKPRDLLSQVARLFWISSEVSGTGVMESGLPADSPSSTPATCGDARVLPSEASCSWRHRRRSTAPLGR